MAKIKILFLSADSTQRLRLDEEARSIQEMIDASSDRAAELVTAWAVRPEDIRKQLLKHRPDIIHFSGHGAEDGEMIFKAEDDTEQPVSPVALADTFALFPKTRAVVLNACHSDKAALKISEEIAFAIGMNSEIGDDAARVFSSAFYLAIASREGIDTAFAHGRSELKIRRIHEDKVPGLFADGRRVEVAPTTATQKRPPSSAPPPNEEEETKTASRRTVPMAAWIGAAAVILGSLITIGPNVMPSFSTPTAPVTRPDPPRASVTSSDGPAVTSVFVSAPESVISGRTFVARLFGNYADGKSNTLTSGVSWTTTDANVLAVVPSGDGMAKREGVALVTGSFEGKTASKEVEVLSAGIWDPPDANGSIAQQNRMHVCPKGTGINKVKGGRGNHNTFYCARLTVDSRSVKDTEEARDVNGSHACPVGYYLRGMNIAENRFTCSTHDGIALAPDSDITVKQYGNLLSCDDKAIAVGFNENEEKILCLPLKGS